MPSRELESSIYTDLSDRQDYAGYLVLETLLDCQHPLSDPPHHDEMLFIVQHQVAELWFKLVIHELEASMSALRVDDISPARKILTRVKKIQQQLYGQWSVLDTLTPTEYAEFRHVFGQASGFQSPQYRLVEFLLGNRDREMLGVFDHQPRWRRRLAEALEAPSLYDEFLRYLARAGHRLPLECLERDFGEMREPDARVVSVLKTIYENPEAHWREYEMCEALMDVASNFQFWRFHHMKTVERIIGHKRGTGGSSGVAFLRRALDQEFFPELIRVRTEIGV